MSARKKQRGREATLSEQLAELSTPRPVSYHPDHEELAEETAARTCSFTYEEEEDDDHRTRVFVSRDPIEDDPRYAGKRISRREMEDGFGGGGESMESDAASGLDDDDVMSGNEDRIIASESGSDQSDQDEQDKHVLGKSLPFSDQSEDEAVPPAKFPAFSLENLKEDIEKGKAARQQLRLWERLLETRIRLQKVLLLGNRLPQCETFSQFQNAGDQQVTMAIRESQSAMRRLLCNLLELQKMLLLKNKDTRKLVDVATTNQDADIDNEEEIPSDFEDSDNEVGNSSKNTDQSESTIHRKATLSAAIPELRGASVSPAVFETHIASVHQRFHGYQDEVIDKWNTKTRLASGKINSKAFVQVDQSVLGQIKHVLQDGPRLVRRTQLKRSVYTPLGKRKRDDSEVGGASSDQSNQHDAHLKDYDEEIFDDDDFYHQLLRQLIERRISYSESTDPVVMGTQWLQLQKLRTKARKSVDTKASKGRKIRYSVHPKLVNFLAPREEGSMSDVSRNDLFSSLFGKTHRTAQ